jgi:hypothetical protein
MTALILDQATLKMLKTAHSITANQNGDRHNLTIFPKYEQPDYRIELPIEGAIRGSNIDKENIDGTSSAVNLAYSELDVFKLLKVGDEIRLLWYPDTGIPYLENYGMVGQKLSLMVWRKNGKSMDLLKLHLADAVYSRSDLYSAMCQGFRRAKVLENA